MQRTQRNPDYCCPPNNLLILLSHRLKVYEPKDVTTHNGMSPPASLRKGPTSMSTVRYYGGIFSTEFPSSDVYSLCQVGIKIAITCK